MGDYCSVANGINAFAILCLLDTLLPTRQRFQVDVSSFFKDTNTNGIKPGSLFHAVIGNSALAPDVYLQPFAGDGSYPHKLAAV
jgi:hypothetical protein